MRIALTDGTHFPQHGADRILHLGILTIVLPLVVAILSAIVRKFLTLPQDAVLKSRKKVLAAWLRLSACGASETTEISDKTAGVTGATKSPQGYS